MWLTCVILTFVVVVKASSEHACNSTISSEDPVVVSSLLADPQSPYHGSPLTCVHRIRPPASIAGSNFVVRIDFFRFRAGELHTPREGNRAACVGGHLTVVDGVNEADEGEARFGKYCGEAEQIRAYYAEYQDVDLVFHTDRFDDDFEYEFEVAWLSPSELPARFGPRSGSAGGGREGMRGNLVTGTFCERVFHACSPRGQPCLVQSPGRPGVYPRGLNCR